MILRLITCAALLTGCGRFGFDVEPIDVGESDAAAPVELNFGERSGALTETVSDTTIKDYEPANNFRDAGFLGAFAPDAGVDSTPGLIRFDLSEAAGRDVISASLEIATHTNLNEKFKGETISAVRILEAWEPTEVTYNERSSGQAWSEPGCNCDARGSEVGRVTTSTELDWASIDLDATVVQDWVDSPDRNFGVILVVLANDGIGTWLASSEYDGETRRPLLRVELAQ